MTLSFFEFIAYAFIILGSIVWVHTPKRKDTKPKYNENSSYEELFEYNSRGFKYIDFDERFLSLLSKVIGKQCNVMEPTCCSYAVVTYIDHNERFNGNLMSAHHIQVKFWLARYEDRDPIFRIDVEAHYGQCQWNGNDMLYNYPITNEQHFLKPEELDNFWLDLKTRYFIITPNDMTDRVRDGEMSMWTENKFGHMLD
jgi:hypothetical protein